MKKVIILFFLISKCFGQSVDKTQPIFKDGNFIKFLDYKFHQKFDKSDFYLYDCETSIGFVKFRIDTTGNLVDMSSSYSINSKLYNSISEIIINTNGKWIPSFNNCLNRKVLSSFFLLPIYYNLGCLNQNIMHKDNIITGLGALQNFDKKPNFLPSQLYNNSENTLECILLHPLYIYAPYR